MYEELLLYDHDMVMHFSIQQNVWSWEPLHSVLSENGTHLYSETWSQGHLYSETSDQGTPYGVIKILFFQEWEIFLYA